MATPFSFGTPTTTSSTLFGQSSTSKPVAGVSPFSFTAPTTTAASSTTLSGLNLSLPKTTTTTSTIGFGASGTIGGLNLSSSSTTSAPTAFGFAASATPALSSSFGFGSTAAATSVAPSFFGASAPTQQQPFSFNSAAAPTFQTSSALNFTAPATSAPVFKGLGGTPQFAISSTTSTPSTIGTGVSTVDGKLGKDSNVPTELLQTVENFKKHLAETKQVRDKLSNFTDRPLMKVNDELASVRLTMGRIATMQSNLAGSVAKLSSDLSETNKRVTMARRLSELPSQQNADYHVPLQMFADFIQDAQTKIRLFKCEIDDLESVLSLRGSSFDSMSSSSAISPSDLVTLLRHLQEGITVITAQLHQVSNQLNEVRCSFQKYRRSVGDMKTYFRSSLSSPYYQHHHNTSGPSPFDDSTVASPHHQHHQQQPQLKYQQPVTNKPLLLPSSSTSSPFKFPTVVSTISSTTAPPNLSITPALTSLSSQAKRKSTS